MRRAAVMILGAGLMIGLLAKIPWWSAQGQEPAAMKIPAPEFKGIDEWINSKPKTLKDLRGQVVVLHFWTFG
jgi:hypothetical protein